MGITSLGATRYNDAFGLAFKIPNLFRRLFGEGALASAFVPVFTEVHEKEGAEKARLLLANAMAISGGLSGGAAGYRGDGIFSLFTCARPQRPQLSDASGDDYVSLYVHCLSACTLFSGT